MFQEIDWNEQAKLHAPGYKDGKIEVEVEDKKFFLLPGPAFGDLSHPSTKIMLSFLKSYVKDRPVLDIGTGSAVLAIASHFLLAKKCYGTEIDSEALVCAHNNVKENALENELWIGRQEDLLPAACFTELTILANMITSEFRYVLKEYADYFAKPGYTIVSGLLKQEKRKLIKELLDLGWKKVNEKTVGEWSGLVFLRH